MLRVTYILLVGCLCNVNGFVRPKTAAAPRGCKDCRHPSKHDSPSTRLSMASRIYVDQVSFPKYTKSTGLSRDEETHYSHLIKSASRIRNVKVIGDDAANDESMDQQRRRQQRIIEDGQAARDALISANIGLVVSIAKRYYYSCVGTILSQHDLVQEGYIGLMDAAERFEPTKGFKFSTYATWWIRQRILRSINDSSRTIRLPAHMHMTLQKIQKTRLRLMIELRREPTTDELAQQLGIPVERLEKALTNSRTVVSLEMLLRSPAAKQETRTISDFLACDAPTAEEEIHAEYLKRDVLEVVNQLPEKERAVILCRFGLSDGKPRNREETSTRLGIRRDALRRIEARALNKLRNPQRNYRLKEYVSSTGMLADVASQREHQFVF
ncbi:hypothetical protein MPSEU_000023900 [Mayamaea pseudoterrestris]|nr:hypothetical protein MPSEU_000023900 [Mayamaea pseudoterrestris]